MFDTEKHSYPQGYKEGPYCPNSTLVEICNSLAGNNVTPETFCTETIENARYSDGFVHYIESADFCPAASCAKATKQLVKQLEIVTNKIEPPSEDFVTNQMNNAKTVEDKIKIADSYKEIKQKYDERESIIERWREVIFKVCCSTTADKKNDHFWRFKSKDELTEEEVVGRVTSFSQALQKVFGHKENTFGWYNDDAINCPQSPHRYHYGSY